MVQNKIVVWVLFIVSIGVTPLWAQNGVVPAGGEASGSGGSVSYTLGQMSYLPLDGTNGSVAQGVQQPYEIFVVTGIEQAAGIDLNLSVYPNPATDFLILKTGNLEMSNLYYYLYDNNGILLENKVIIEDQTMVAMNRFSSAIYYLKVVQNNQEIKVFKIIKK